MEVTVATEREKILATIRVRALELRQERRLDSSDLAHRAGYSASAVRNFISGGRDSVKIAIALARAWPEVGRGLDLVRLATLEIDRRRPFGAAVARRRRRRAAR